MDIKNMGKVSVITPSYNSAHFILETIESVQSQTYTNWEMIIVDDCSNDHSVELIEAKQSADERIKFIKLTRNSGPAYARNQAILAAEGRYLAFLDSDDCWLPEKLEKQISFMHKNDYSFSYTAYRIMREEGELTEIVFHMPSQITYKDLLKNTAIGTLTVVLNQEKIGTVKMPLYRDCSEDYGLWMSILSQGITAYGLNEELALYRKCNESLSSNKWKSARKTWNTYRKVGRSNLPSTMWYFLNYSVRAVKKHTRTP
ncbi:glycosyltransferase family 2 protein [Halobacillus sp. GSS1]|uniref:glycosyltransferase family 2 protein n=1 Tax=Halobacillus sp. GSS1 TaxID=2815919 RepID=UPI001A904EAC|nr:glycosyltransferase family 2 protein [Halobacillus sp. GSS1]MBN9654997.1 glycosyltransferase family 2 protein [Halobacillus sp. GSS1]